MVSILNLLFAAVCNDELRLIAFGRPVTRAHCNTDKEFNLLTRNCVFPYDYIDSWERFTETCLPSKTNFYSQLYDQCITDQDYQHALDVWKTFNIKTLGKYSDLYLKNDVLLLADIFENFRRTCLLTYCNVGDFSKSKSTRL
ncbi:hypothetical protein NQ315_012435 [Exocentrus adspersus]|uniref:Uncharacterized protein n=1 Tax=Exocentrus adspersus TaxID=1586481 RepID=A0AAV8VNZ7_9CUCU|nr:hypothetical protein NQ315_012435 [Exocentrus adspersus]